MREQSHILEYHPQRTPRDRNVDVCLRIEQHAIIQHDSPACWAQQAGDGVQRGCLAASGVAEQCQRARFRMQRELQSELSARKGEVEFDHATCSVLRVRRSSSAAPSVATSATISATQVSRSAPLSPPGVSSNSYSAIGSVRVCPGIEETKVIVAPNSPKARAKASASPATSPRNDKGRVMPKKIRHALAPRVAAACSSLRSTDSNAERSATTSSGNAITPAASAAPVQRNAIERCNASSTRPIAP